MYNSIILYKLQVTVLFAWLFAVRFLRFSSFECSLRTVCCVCSNLELRRSTNPKTEKFTRARVFWVPFCFCPPLLKCVKCHISFCAVLVVA